MQKIANARGDPISRLHNALYAGDVHERIAVLKDVGMSECVSAWAETRWCGWDADWGARLFGVLDSEDQRLGRHRAGDSRGGRPD